jgi:hypothetical protein
VWYASNQEKIKPFRALDVLNHKQVKGWCDVCLQWKWDSLTDKLELEYMCFNYQHPNPRYVSQVCQNHKHHEHYTMITTENMKED